MVLFPSTLTLIYRYIFHLKEWRVQKRYALNAILGFDVFLFEAILIDKKR
jgi:hypothetical protein